MSPFNKPTIEIEAIVGSRIDKIWALWTLPEHITKWHSASPDWHTPKVIQDLRKGGKFNFRMEARNGGYGFDFCGTYLVIKPNELLEFVLDDGRNVRIEFIDNDAQTQIIETFELENSNTIEMQTMGWQAILDNFKHYAESLLKLETLEFEILIQASVEKVYQTMLDSKTYAIWAAVFDPGTQFKGNWGKGTKMLFLSPDSSGIMQGSVSQIEENIPNQFVSIKQLGFFQNGREITNGPEVEGWAGAFENYLFSEKEGKTHLQIRMDTNKKFNAYFQETWPKALKKLKYICEK